MKTLSNKAFNLVLNMMANKPMTAERLSTILDADKDESIDAYFFGRLASVKVRNEGALQSLLIRKTQQNLFSAVKLNKVIFNGVRVISVGKIEVLYSYEYTSDGGKSTERKTRYTCLATDEENDGIFEFEYKD